MKRRFERKVRLVAGLSPAPSLTMKRSISEGENTTSGSGSRPTEVAKVSTLAAA